MNWVPGSDSTLQNSYDTKRRIAGGPVGTLSASEPALGTAATNTSQHLV